MEVGPVLSEGAYAELKGIKPFMKYFTELVMTEVYNDVLFITERNENIWWYDGERIVFRSPNYSKILNAMLSQPALSLSDLQSALGINRSAVQKLIAQLTAKKYVERGEKDGSWRVFITPLV